MISFVQDRFLDGQLLPTPHLYFLYLGFFIGFLRRFRG